MNTIGGQAYNSGVIYFLCLNFPAFFYTALWEPLLDVIPVSAGVPTAVLTDAKASHTSPPGEMIRPTMAAAANRPLMKFSAARTARYWMIAGEESQPYQRPCSVLLITDIPQGVGYLKTMIGMCFSANSRP